MDKTTQRICPVCSVKYLAQVGRLKHGRQTTCSRKCSYIRRAKIISKITILECPVCGKDFSRPPSQIKGKHGSAFCSRVCHYAGRGTGLTRRIITTPYVVTDKGRAAWKVGGRKARDTRIKRDNYRHTKESRAKLSIATARALAKGVIGRPSGLENKVAHELDLLGCNYVRQYFIRDGLGKFAAVLDFYIPASNCAIEVNGTYWHCDPRIYPSPINEMQQRCVDRYTRKIELLKSSGIRLVEIWEEDFKKGPSEAVFVAHSKAIG
tara:strand:+ start:443 stop:1237 length:795 start_codon:yes stop_codon:yes gene_type:complete